MTRKIFLSFLGISPYKPVRYYMEEAGRLPDFRVEKYVQKALLDYLSKGVFSAEDAAYIFLTDLASEKNWVSAENGEPQLADMVSGAYTFPVSAVPVPDESSSAGIWDTFLTVFDCLQEGDTVYLDITHSWRYLPMLGATLLHYAKSLKNIRVAAIYYGALERLAPVPAIDKIPEPERWTPVLNLVQFSELQDWSAAAHDFVHYGYPERWNELARAGMAAQSEKHQLRTLKSINEKIQRLAALIRANRGMELHRFSYEGLKAALSDFSADDNQLKPLNAIINLVGQKLAPFSDADPLRWLKQVDWCRRHQLWQQGLTQLQEGFLTWLCDYFEAKQIAPIGFFKWDKHEPRSLVSETLNLCKRQLPEEKWVGIIKKHKKTARQIMQFDVVQDLAETYYQLSGIRNDINHSGYTNNTKAEKFATLLDRYYHIFEEKLSKNYDSYLKQSALDEPVELPPLAVLLNLSNHPSSSWSAPQLDAARALYGEVEDMPFPPIPPDADAEQVRQLAQEYFEKVVARRPAAVHLMGEMTFTYYLVGLLQEAGIDCIASTTERFAEERDGQKIVTFRFVRFRDY